MAPVASPSSILLPDVQDSASQTRGNMDGLSYCGDRQYEFANPELVPAFISI